MCDRRGECVSVDRSTSRVYDAGGQEEERQERARREGMDEDVHHNAPPDLPVDVSRAVNQVAGHVSWSSVYAHTTYRWARLPAVAQLALCG